MGMIPENNGTIPIVTTDPVTHLFRLRNSSQNDYIQPISITSPVQ